MVIDPTRPTTRYRFDDSLALRTRACLLDLLRDAAGAGVCPSEAARVLAQGLDVEWRDLMRPVRIVAAELAREGRVDIRQDGQLVDILEARGPLRLHWRER
jgi:Protein of unknown function (DUF3253)